MVLKECKMGAYKDIIQNAIGRAELILDLGCGSGKFEPLNEVNTEGKTIIGIDIDLDELKQNPFLRAAVVGNVEHLPFRDSAFDLIMTRSVLEHIEEPDSLFSEISRVMKPSGEIVIQTFNKWHPLNFISFALSERTRAKLKKLFTYESKLEGNYETYYRCNTKRALTNFLSRNGFSIKNFYFEDIGLRWVRSPIIKYLLRLFQVITNIRFLRGAKHIITCWAKR